MSALTILVVDDDPKVLKNLTLLLGGEYEILTAPSAEEAGAILGREKIHILISDYRMPGQDGLSFLIDAKSEYPEMIRVLLTAHGDIDLVVRAINEGDVHRFVSKPYRAAELLQIVDECAQLAGAGVEEPEHAVPEKTVVLAHDSHVTLSTLQVVLGRTYKLLTTSNGLEVVSMVTLNPVDALIIGIGLEMMDGCTIVSYLKKEKKVSFPILVWSRHISESLRDYIKKCGADLIIDGSEKSSMSVLLEYFDTHLS